MSKWKLGNKIVKKTKNQLDFESSRIRCYIYIIMYLLLTRLEWILPLGSSGSHRVDLRVSDWLLTHSIFLGILKGSMETKNINCKSHKCNMYWQFLDWIEDMQSIIVRNVFPRIVSADTIHFLVWNMYLNMYNKKSRIDTISTLFGWLTHKSQVNKKESGNNGRSAV